MNVFSNVSVFGLNSTLIDGAEISNWNQAVNPNPQTPDRNIKVTIPEDESEIGNSGKTEHYKGPSATFAVGPVPVTVSSFLDATVDVTGWTIFTPPPMKQNTPGVGDIGVKAGGHSNVNVGIDAGIDLIVLSVGVDGDLQLIAAGVDGQVETFIDPMGKKMTAHKEYNFLGSALNGKLSIFIELDLGIYTKRWTFDVASFDGVSLDKPVAPVNVVGLAVIPEVAKPTCQ